MHELGSEPETSAIAAEVGLSLGEVEWLCGVMRDPVSLWTEIGRDGDQCLVDTVKDEESEQPIDVVIEKDLKEKVREALETLSYREKKVLGMRYGISGIGSDVKENIAVDAKHGSGHASRFLRGQ